MYRYRQPQVCIPYPFRPMMWPGAWVALGRCDIELFDTKAGLGPSPELASHSMLVV